MLKQTLYVGKSKDPYSYLNNLYLEKIVIYIMNSKEMKPPWPLFKVASKLTGLKSVGVGSNGRVF